MQKLQNLSIRNKFFLIVAPLLFGVLYLVFIKTSESYTTSQELTKLEKSVDVSTEISYLVHEIQKERGNSSGFLSNKGTRFGDQLLEQRQLTDKQLSSFQDILQNPEYKNVISAHQNAIDELVSLLEGISEIRANVNNIAYTANDAIDIYTIINTHALNTANDLVSVTADANIARETQAYINFLKSKERAGIERAVGSQAFSLKTLNPELYKRFSTLVAEQGSYNDAFLATATTDGAGFFRETLVGEAVDEVERMRGVLYANEALEDDPIYWFATITKKIELLKKVENYLTGQVIDRASSAAAQANTEFVAFSSVTAVLILVILILLFSILRGFLGNINKLSAFAGDVATGDLDGSVDIKAKDEIGQFARTLNDTVGSIRNARNDLQAEKDKAEELYETIYKTSEVVFANVDQGVFLINSKMEISKLYSQALKKIFDKADFAGKNFLDLMGPMLVPRDKEALKVFAKHLFNPKVKSNVLKRLNPVEEVEIFSGDSKKVDGLNSKFIEISFSRVARDNRIDSVMVTVLDVTESKLLQNKIKENEQKSKVETEQLLSIMKINPGTLREYLDKAMTALNEIYQRYETEKTKDFQALATYTFNVVHNLKGNATLIELDLLQDKFHGVEEALVKLRGTRIEGSDFLQILYEINEIKATITDMLGMIRKIASIYYNTADENEIFSNDKIIRSFERAAERIGNETGKKVNFSLENPNEVLIPEKLKMHVNDMVLQLVRNSVIHGIETPVDRASMGKSSEGNIKLSISETLSGSLRIKYQDDGRGLDMQKILSKAQRKGIISPEELEGIEVDKAYDLIFHNGLSTADKTSIHAGRGQGMSVVKAILDKIHGDYTIQSFDGQGFEIVLSIPVNSYHNDLESIMAS